MAEPSLVAAGEEPEERAIEAALRPKNLDDFVGQHRVRKQLSLVHFSSRSSNIAHCARQTQALHSARLIRTICRSLVSSRVARAR